ncbi:MAG: NERD domain-containing protein [Oscillospiraceae bacterium]
MVQLLNYYMEEEIMGMETLVSSIVIALVGAVLVYLFMDDENKKLIFKKKVKASDDKGEDNLLKVLKRFASVKNFDVLPKTTLKIEDTQFTFDAILVGFFGTIGISSVNLSGEIYGETNSDQWAQVLEGKRAEFANPLKEMNGSVRFFKEIYKEEKVKCGSVDSLVVFTSKKAQLYAGKKSPAISIDKLYSKLDVEKYLTDNGGDMEAMKAAIAKYTVK